MITILASALSAGPRVDVEVDPVNIALGGTSLHLGLTPSGSPVRIDLAAYSIPVPALLHGDDDIEQFLAGLSVRADRFFSPQAVGPYVGVQAATNRNEAIELSSGIATSHRDLRLGLQIGYRAPIGDAGFYLNPWLAGFYRLGPQSVTAGQTTFTEARITPFPALHLGWAFQ